MPQLSPSVPAPYSAPIDAFLATDDLTILGALSNGAVGDIEATQRQAWTKEFEVLRGCLAGCHGSLFLEFEVARIGSRIDVVIISGAAIIPIEFKCGESSFTSSAYNQAWDYGLDLKNFHEASHEASVFPILVATEAPAGDGTWGGVGTDNVWAPRRATASSLRRAIDDAIAAAAGPAIDADAWARARYRPTPTIIEAARSLYARHTVDAIAHTDAGKANLQLTANAVEEIVHNARGQGAKSIVFVTGVPGAGKTLVGLDIATRKHGQVDEAAVYLSGNAPLVAVLREALIRDEVKRLGSGLRDDVRQRVKAFIQNIHHFRDEGIRDPTSPPHDRVVIFDEAQRAWDLTQTADFMKRRKGIPNFRHSESEFLISYLQRHDGWAVVVCLVGGGQEIHKGEAGIAAWLEAAIRARPAWRVHLAPSLVEGNPEAEAAMLDLQGDARMDPRLHLATSVRSFRSEHVSSFVDALLSVETQHARTSLGRLLGKYPIVVTRDLATAKQWVRDQVRGSERSGLVASSQAQRLKPHAIDVRVSINPIHWFLGKANDTRSSSFLEDAATEFQVQGLELDWTCVTWDADLRFVDGGWRYHSFRGPRWTNVGTPSRRRYMLNAYRVLLTRARQGMAIFVPRGDPRDHTRLPSFYDDTYQYLVEVGLRTI